MLEASRVQTLYIEPGSPWENGYSESLGSRFRDELLDRELFVSLAEAKVLAEQHRVYHNRDRPHSSLGYQTPAEFAVSLAEPPPLSRVEGEALDSPEGGEVLLTLS